MVLNRRQVLASAAAGPAVAQLDAPPTTSEAQAFLERYVGLGDKFSGGPGDLAVGAWLESALEGLGFETQRSAFEAPFFDIEHSELSSGPLKAAVWPQPLVVVTPATGVSGPLVVRQPWSPPEDLTGKIVMIPLPYARWSTVSAPPVSEPVRAAAAAGASAVILITVGPTGQAIRLNADAVRPLSDRPVATLAPRDAAPFLKAAGEGRMARLVVNGRGGRRPTFNLVGRLDRGRGRWLVVSTPRSGWDICAGERGPGVAVWLMMARWAAKSLPLDLMFLCNSGHEYENLGAAHALRDVAPPVDRTALWIHLGANVAARDWRELPGGALSPLPSADPQHVLAATAKVAPACQETFRGLAGLEAVSIVDALGAPGELGPILRAGYERVAGAYGAHRFHHTEGDDGRCVSGPLSEAAYQAFVRLTSSVLSADR